MGRKQGPRKGSMQVWPRKRSYDFLPGVNWGPINERNNSTKTNILGFIGYKVGMVSAFVKDNTADSMTKNKRIILPATVLECPPVRILSVRLYRNGKVEKEILNEHFEKELKRVIKLPKNKTNIKELLEKIKLEDFEDLRLIIYSEAKKTEIKKTPDIAEVALSGKKEEKLAFVKEHIAKEISVSDFIQKGTLDVRGVSKGKGFQGAVKRFGIRLRFHKSEKGVRRVGSIGAWHPIGVRFRVPMPGQTGGHTRIVYNKAVLASKKLIPEDPINKRTFNNFGVLKTDYILLMGSVLGSQKRQLFLTYPLRPTKKQTKRNYEVLELR